MSTSKKARLIRFGEVTSRAKPKFNTILVCLPKKNIFYMRLIKLFFTVTMFMTREAAFSSEPE